MLSCMAWGDDRVVTVVLHFLALLFNPSFPSPVFCIPQKCFWSLIFQSCIVHHCVSPQLIWHCRCHLCIRHRLLRWFDSWSSTSKSVKTDLGWARLCKTFVAVRHGFRCWLQGWITSKTVETHVCLGWARLCKTFIAVSHGLCCWLQGWITSKAVETHVCLGWAG